MPRAAAVVVAVCAAAVAAAGCGALATAPRPASHPATTTPAPAAAAATPGARRIGRLTAIAEHRYLSEVEGSAVHHQLRRVAADPALRAALATGDLPALRAVVAREQATPRAHISRLRVVRGGRVLAQAGVPFVVAPAQQTLRGAGGRVLGTVQVSIQDVIGFVRVMHRNWPVDIVVRGRGPAHVRSSLPAARHARLPANGTVRIAGRRYLVRSFHRVALDGEPITIWVLARA